MKRNAFRTALAAVVMLAATAGAAAQTTTKTQGVLGRLGQALTNASQQKGAGSLLSSVGSVISSKLVPTDKQIVGTWVYDSPAIAFTSSNALTQLGGTAASKQIETKLQEHLTKYGIKKGQMSMTFNTDKTFSVTYKKKTYKGTYAIKDKAVQLTFNGRQQPCKMTPQLEDGTLVIAADATKLKTFLQGINVPGTGALSVATSLLKKFNTMQIGMRLIKK